MSGEWPSLNDEATFTLNEVPPLMKNLAPLLVFLLLAPVLSSCVETEDTTDSDKTDETAIQWTTEDFAGIPLDQASLAVPLNPDDLSSEQLAHIEVYRVENENPDAPSLVILQGGPGGDVGELLGYIGPDENLERLHETHTLYFVNSRGLGEDRDEFCTDVEDGWHSSPDAMDQLTECLETEQEYLRYLTTRTTAFDLDVLRRTLGLASWSIYGVSYGTAVAAAYAEEFADHLDSVILDGTLDPTRAVLDDGANASLDSLAQLSVDCAESDECPAEFADDAFGIIDALLVQADEGWTVDVFQIDGELTQVEVTREVFLASLVGFLSSTDARMSLPQALVDASNGDDAGLSEGLSSGSGAARSDLVNLVVICRELWNEPSALEPPDETTIFGALFRENYDAMCPTVLDILGETRISHPVSSVVPALLLSGEGDNRTPPAYGDSVASRFQNSTHAILRGHSHGVVDSPCGSQIFLTFLADSASSLDLGCTDTPPEWPIDFDFDF